LKVLFFTPRQCWPPDSGARLRDYHLVQQIGARCELTYLGFSDPQADQGPDPALGAVIRERVMVPGRVGYSIGNITRGLVAGTALPILNYTTPQMDRALEDLLRRRRFDLVHLGGVHLSEYVERLRTAPDRPMLVCDWHNIESELMDRYSKSVGNPLLRVYAAATAARLRAAEKRLLQLCDMVTVTSDRERRSIESRWPSSCPLRVVENGVDLSAFTLQGTVPPEHTHSRNKFLFVGSLDYHANIDAVTYFANDIWPRVLRAHPEFRFQIVGRSPAKSVRALAVRPGIEVIGAVADVRPYYRGAFASIVPLRVGGGTRLKILESMAAGTPVISTRLGAEGLEVEDGGHILLADRPDHFLNAITSLRARPQQWAHLARSGQQLVRSRYDWTAIGARLGALYEAVVTRGPSGEGGPAGNRRK
jgi:sugar transferase (PEP-CTERM/EpsH1 system associated)